jgi:hypothetical protein
LSKTLDPVVERAGFCYPSWYGKSWLLLSQLVLKELATVILVDMVRLDLVIPAAVKRLDVLSLLLWKNLAPVISAAVERAGFCYPSCCGKSWLLLTQLLWKELASVIPATVERADSCYSS